MDSGSVEMYKRALADGKVSVHSIRVMLVGHSGVGKTTLLKRLLNRPVIIDEKMSTEGIEVHVCHCKVDLHNKLWINSEGDTRNLREDSLARCLHFSGDTLGDKPTEKSVESNIPVLETTPSVRESQEDIGDQEDDPNPGSIRFDLQDNQEDIDDQEDDPNPGSIRFDLRDNQENTDDLEDDPNPDQTTTPDSHQPQTTVISNVPEEDTKHVENFLKVRISLPDEQYASVSFWDFAGQSIFYNTHQVFLANRTIYLLLTNLENSIDTTVAEGETNENHGKKVKDFVDFWVNSIHFFCGKGPPVILVATHADKLDAQSRDRRIESHFQSLRDMFDEKVTGNHIRDDIQFAIDNTRIDENLEYLKKAIFDVATEQEYWGELQPARWITLEQELDNLRRDGRRIVGFVEVEGINQRLPVPLKGPDEIDLFLRFQNDTGNFLFVSEEGLNHYVLLDPQWVIDALKCVITAEDFFKNRMGIRKYWKELKRTGKLTRDIIDAVWENKTSFSDHKQFLLLLMQRLNLIARYEEPEKDPDHFFVPCFITERAIFEDLPSQIGPHTSSVLTLTVPSMFFPLVTFHKLIASCINHFKIRKKGERYYIYNECAVFWAGNECLFTLFYIDNGVKVWVTGPVDGNNAKSVNKACQSVLQFLLNVIKRLKVCCNEEGETEVDIYAHCPKLPFSNVQDSFKVPSNIQEWQSMELDQSCDAHEGDQHALSKEDLLRNWILCVNCDYDEQLRGMVNSGGEVPDETGNSRRNKCDSKRPGDHLLSTGTVPISAEVTEGAKMKKLGDDTMDQYLVTSLKEHMHNVGALVHGERGHGTVFRVGSKYVMTAKHVVSDIIDPGRTGREDANLLKGNDVHVTFSGSLYQPGPLTYKIKEITYDNQALDVAILEIENYHTTAFPSSMVLCKCPLDQAVTEISLIGFGHPSSFKKQLDPRCRIKYEDDVYPAIDYLRTNRQMYKDQVRGYQSNTPHMVSSVDQLYNNFNNPDKLLWSCYMENGGSGSPVINHIDHKSLKVVALYTHAIPGFLQYLDPMHKSHYPCDKRFEMGPRMSSIFLDLQQRNIQLANELFPGDC